MKIASIDLSLTATGFALSTDGHLDGFRIIPGKGDGIERLISGRNRIMDQVEEAKPDLVIMEDLAFSQNQAFAKENAGLAYMVRAELHTDKIPFLVAGPSQVKKFVTGSGGAKKEIIIKEVLRRFGVDCPDNNTADAVSMAYLAMALVGDWEPTTQAQLEVVAQIQSKNSWVGRLAKPSPAPEVQPTLGGWD